ncbi:TadE/TadG family type IV pilus assembly protein [Nocardioides mangrovicus]|uniref:TadE/TadG family type IV pilus assembly protein n=1 Tax=Nocardioides mangrovicus TaxID=2478913 RepID=UPI00131430C5|nr:TadE/TadG family type IV pilus assembly protein [Nocardioides mangrovicus]
MQRSLVRRRDEHGFVAIFATICLSAFLFGCAAIGIDIARWYLEGAREQNAADAASLGAVVWLPDNIDKAKSTAADLAQDNGYVDGTNNTTVSAALGAKPTQLQVTVCRTVTNSFGVVLGFGSTKVCRTSTADYTGPQPMGSPCNTLGNEPAGTTAKGPTDSQLVKPSGATCSSTPQFWMHISGPMVPKAQGDQYDTRTCSSGNSGCSGTTNSDFRPEGYFLLVRVAATAVNTPIRLQLYDPEFAATNNRCESGPTGTFPTTDNWNKWTSSDGLTRYKVTSGSDTPNAFCTGDVAATTTPTVTSFALRSPTDTQDPTKATPVAGCTKQWPGYSANDVTINNLFSSTNPGAFDTPLSESFHQWVTLCDFTPSVAGDYYVQVRSNVAIGGSVNNAGQTDGSYQPPDAASSKVYTQTGDDTSVTGGGSNRYAVRAFYASGTTPAGAVSVAAFGRMPIYMNSNASTATFNLIRVLPAAAGKSMNFTFFDMGDAASSGTVTVLPPNDSNMGGTATNCTATGFINQTLSTCALSGVSSGNGADGKSETISVPIPSTYTCSYASAGGCWFQVKINFPSGTVTDTTTWTANISGQPVRLIQ